MRSVVFLAVASAAVMPSPAAGQFPPERLKNIQVLPTDISVRALLDTMGGFTRALGVRCAYCHFGSAGASFETLDFPADSLATKAKGL